MPASASGGDVFDVETRDGRVVIRGPNGVSMAMGLNWYCRSAATATSDSTTGGSRFRTRRRQCRRACGSRRERVWYFFNYVTFAYTMAWWQWPDWERMIDWMALNGVNLPLAITGQEAVWTQVTATSASATRRSARSSWGPPTCRGAGWATSTGWAGRCRRAGSPGTRRREILARERGLGMTPILQAFTGHVPYSGGTSPTRTFAGPGTGRPGSRAPTSSTPPIRSSRASAARSSRSRPSSTARTTSTPPTRSTRWTRRARTRASWPTWGARSTARCSRRTRTRRGCCRAGSSSTRRRSSGRPSAAARSSGPCPTTG